MENGRLVYGYLKEKGIDAALLTDEVSTQWVSGFAFTDGMVLVTGQETLLLTDPRYIEAAEKETHPDVRCILGGTNMLASVRTECTSRNVRTLAFDPTRLTVAEYSRLREALNGVELKAFPGLCDGFRKIKTKKEIENIRVAQSITDAAFTHICSVLHKGMTELEVAAELEYFMRKNGASGLAFETIAVSGAKSSMPHGVPGNVVLTENSFLTMDYGARYNGYCSDMTRTVVIGKATDEMKHVYETVLSAQKAAIASLRPGITGKEVDAAARDVITNAGYGECFGHGTGHSLGLEIHERPASNMRSDEVFAVGQVQTSEPGIYLPGKFGVRIEDLLLVTENGCEDLTQSDKSLIEL